MNKYFYLIPSTCCILYLLSCNKKPNGVAPRYGDLLISVYASGNIQAKDQYTVYPEASGILVHKAVSEGDLVQKGTLLFEIKNDIAVAQKKGAQLIAEYNALSATQTRLEELKTSIDQAKSKAQNDSIMYVRIKKLYDDGVSTTVELEQKMLAWTISKKNVQSLLLKYNDIQNTLELSSKQTKRNADISTLTTLQFQTKSLIQGKVYAIYKRIGETVNQNTALATIGHDNKFIASMQLDEEDIGKVQIGQTAYIKFEAYPDRIFEFNISNILPMMNLRTRTFTVEAEFENREKLFYPNMSFEANILIEKKENVLLIPSMYLLPDTTVLLQDGIKQKVRIGNRNYQWTEIEAGIDTSNRIQNIP